MNKSQIRFYPESTFGDFTDVDGTVAFYCRVNALAEPSFVVVDVGCGRGAQQGTFKRRLRCLKGKVSRVIGIDVDAAARFNDMVDEFRLFKAGGPWPVLSGSANMVVCDWVMEHLSDPSAFFQQCKRVLIQGGYLCIRTTNIHSYVGLASKLLPNRFHSAIVSKVQQDREDRDVFPTVYRCNTISAMRQELKKSGFEGVVYGYEAEPSYLKFSTVAYAMGVLYQRLAPAFLKTQIFVFARNNSAMIESSFCSPGDR